MIELRNLLLKVLKEITELKSSNLFSTKDCICCDRKKDI